MANVPGPLDPVFFDSAQEILQWTPAQASPLVVGTVPLAPRIPASGVRFLMGLDNGPWTYWTEFDANPQGARRGNVYNFQHWQYVDAMYYYVHRLVAIPPAVWINAAHRNGVKIFSAVTADCGDDGGERFNALFTQPKAAAQQLVLMARTFGFDGWMFDVENGADPNDNLREAMAIVKSMLLPNGLPTEVGYYEGGRLSIDSETFPFFQTGHFFQSDYTSDPKPDAPEQTYTYLVSKGQAASRFATYWSAYPNFFAGGDHGLFNGYEYLDIDAFFGQIRQTRMPPPSTDAYQSIGIYGPDWTMYGGHNSTSDPLPSREVFHRTDRRLWVGDVATLHDDGTTQTSDPAVSNFIAPRSSIVSKPFLTRLNTGEGSLFAIGGQRVNASEWNHLSSQDRLPTWLMPLGGGTPPVTADYSYDNAYDGGSSLECTGTLGPGQTAEYALFKTQIRMDGRTTVKLRYLLTDPQSALPYLRLVFSNQTTTLVTTATRGDGWLLAQQFFGQQPLDLVQINLGFINNTAAPVNVHALIGEIGILDPPAGPPPDIITPQRNGTRLTWPVPTGFWQIWYYNVFSLSVSGLTFVGRAFMPAYELSGPLFPPNGQTFRIQPVTTGGEASAVPLA